MLFQKEIKMKALKSVLLHILIILSALFCHNIQAQETALESFTKYDFVPGDDILLFEDFSQDAIGNFPALWTTNGNGEVNHVIIWIQNRRVRIYHRGEKVLDSPTNIVKVTRFNHFRFCAWDSESMPFISNLKISSAAPDTRSKLITEGKLISYGICFDSGKDIVRPESYGALKDIADVLNENPGIRIKITGHTDSDGDDKMNLELSARRAVSVMNVLSNTFGIDASVMEAEGVGEAQPIVPNNSSGGKAKNRRVEFIKL